MKELEMINILLEEETENFKNVQEECEKLIDEAKNKKLNYCNTLCEILESSTKKKVLNTVTSFLMVMTILLIIFSVSNRF